MAEGALYRVTADGLVAAIVRTPAGAKKYGQPIGSVIVPDVVPDIEVRVPKARVITAVSAPSKGHVPTAAEVSAAAQAMRRRRNTGKRGVAATAAYLDAAGYNERPTVLPTEAFDAFQGKAVPHAMYHFDSGSPVMKVEPLAEFWRGIEFTQKTGTDPYNNMTIAAPEDFYVGRGIYTNGTHVGRVQAAVAHSGRVLPPPTVSTRFENNSVMIRVKIHPDARVGRDSDAPPGTSPKDIVQWAVEQGYDVLDLSSNKDGIAGVAILNRSVMVIEEIKDEDTGRVEGVGTPGEPGPDVSAGGPGDSGLGSTAAGLPAEGRSDLSAALGTLDRTLIAAGDSWRWQLRDKNGRWIEMGSEVKWLARGRWLHGLVVGSPSPGIADVREYETGRNQLIAASRLQVVEEAETLLKKIDTERAEKGAVDWRGLDLTTEKTSAEALAPTPKPPIETVPIQEWERGEMRREIIHNYEGALREDGTPMSAPAYSLTDAAIDARIKYMGRPKPKSVLRRGGVDVVVWQKQKGPAGRRTGKLTKETTEILEHAEWLQTVDPTHDGRTIISLRDNPRNEDWEAFAELNENWMVMDVDWVTLFMSGISSSWDMKTKSEYPSSLFSMTHEYGHMRDDRTDKQRTEDETGIKGIPGMSKYGEMNTNESYAEAYAEWILSYGTTTNDAALYFANKYGWPIPKERNKWRP